jgi:hypothetical protein
MLKTKTTTSIVVILLLSISISNISLAQSNNKRAQKISFSGIELKLGDEEETTLRTLSGRFQVDRLDSKKPNYNYYLVIDKPTDILGVITFHSGKLVKAYRDWTPHNQTAYELVLSMKGAVEVLKKEGDCILDTKEVREPNYLYQSSSIICGDKSVEVIAINSSKHQNNKVVNIYEWLGN